MCMSFFFGVKGCVNFMWRPHKYKRASWWTESFRCWFWIYLPQNSPPWKIPKYSDAEFHDESNGGLNFWFLSTSTYQTSKEIWREGGAMPRLFVTRVYFSNIPIGALQPVCFWLVIAKISFILFVSCFVKQHPGQNYVLVDIYDCEILSLPCLIGPMFEIGMLGIGDS
jgi:hypothetical protein